MIPNGSPYENYPAFGNNGTKTPPGGSTESAKYALGMVPADTFPAEWANYLFHGATAGITRLNADVGSIKKEINTVLADLNITNDASAYDQLLEALNKIKAAAVSTAEGNIIGTALGTTDKNIVVTDTSGKLKPSGTVIGSAAGKTAGSAAGNVPLVGTALGTTNNNIVVTDANGKLKPSGTTMGSAAGKTAGSAAGNVPLVGTALGTTDKNIVVTDTAGKLKPSGTTLGSAAGKTAGSAKGNVPLINSSAGLGTTNNNIVVTDASGNLKASGTTIGSAAGLTAGTSAGDVPTIGTALGTTNNNIVVTDANGKLKPFGKTPTAIAYWGNGGAICSTAAATAAKTASISGFALYNGVTVKVMFTNGNTNSAPTLNVNSTGAKDIKVVKAGNKFAPPVHTGKWRGSSSSSSESWQPLTTLELMYDGTDWVIIGNPIVENYESTSESYTVYADGMLEQWVRNLTKSSGQTWIYPVVFSNTPAVFGNYNRGHTYWCLQNVSTTSVGVYQDDSGGTWDIFVKGY